MTTDVTAIARVTLSHEGVAYTFNYPHPFVNRTAAEVEADILFQWTDGNYGCDCNCIPFIETYCDVDLGGSGGVPCGHTVSLVNLEAVYPDGTVTQVYPDPHRVTERLAALGLTRYG